MNRMVRMVFRAAAALAGVAPAAVAAEKPLARPAVAQPACARRGAAGVGELHRAWILTGWEKRAGDPPWEFDAKLGRFYDGSSDAVHLYDDFDPAHRVARSAAEYAAIWTPPFTALRSAHHAVIDGPDVLLGTGDLATSTLEFAARLEAADRKVIGIRTRSTTVWRCRDGAWKIVREHNSSRTLPDGAIDELVPTPVARPARAAPGASNERLVAAAFQRWAAGGTRFFDELLAPDVKWTIAGSGPPAGTYHGRDASSSGRSRRCRSASQLPSARLCAASGRTAST